MKNICCKILILLFSILNFTAFSQIDGSKSLANKDTSKRNENIKTSPNNFKNPVLKNIGFLLFNNFETLDVFGPAEIFGRLKDIYKIEFYSLEGGVISSTQNVKIVTEKLSENEKFDIFLIPGGLGTRKEVENPKLISAILNNSISANHVLTVCTGSALLAKTGLLNGMAATSNKRAFEWASSQESKVNWVKKARWTADGKYYTSSGISAGMDMTLGYIKDIYGMELARKIAYEIEYTWQENKDLDPFYLQNKK